MKQHVVRRPSLTGRLLTGLIGLQAGLIALSMMIFPLLSSHVDYSDVADETARALLRDSLRRDARGQLILAPTEALLRYAARRARFRFAVLDRIGGSPGVAIAGSDVWLTGVLQRLGDMLPLDGKLSVELPGTGRGTALISPQNTALGPVVFVTAGNEFHIEDVPSFFDDFMPVLLPVYAPILFGVVVVVPLVVRSATRPLNAAAREAERIDLRSLGARLPDGELPRELAPLVAAVNGTLARLDDGVQRQRLFSANAAHELRTPVAILQARLDALPPELPERTALLRDVRRITLLVDQLLAVARLGHREAAMDETVDLAAAARSVVADCAPLALRAGRAVALAPPACPALVRGNVRAIESALANIIDNALRVEPRGGTVQVTVQVPGTIEIADHGPGIAPGDRSAVFEPFWRKDERQPGTGLGLAIVQEVARLHGGWVEVRDTPGGGATFCLCLPGEDAAPRQAGAMQALQDHGDVTP